MQRKSSCKIPFGVKSLAEMMAMSESEVRFFPKLEDLKEHIKNYNYCMYSKPVLMDNLLLLKERCKEAGLDTYLPGIDNLMKAVQYRY